MTYLILFHHGMIKNFDITSCCIMHCCIMQHELNNIQFMLHCIVACYVQCYVQCALSDRIKIS